MRTKPWIGFNITEAKQGKKKKKLEGVQPCPRVERWSHVRTILFI